MSEVLDRIQGTLVMASGSVGITALLIAGIVGLWCCKFENRDEAAALFWYGLITLITVINPLYTIPLGKYFPELLHRNMYLWMLPTVPIILYVGVITVVRFQERKKKILFYIGLVGVLVLAATTSYSENELKTGEGPKYMTDERMQLFLTLDEYLDAHNMQECMIWGPREIIEDARKYSGRYHTMYGKDLWNDDIDTQLYQTYESWAITAYELMNDPLNNKEDVISTAKVHKVDALVLRKEDFEKSQTEIEELLGDIYLLEYVGDGYVLYMKTGY